MTWDWQQSDWPNCGEGQPRTALPLLSGVFSRVQALSEGMRFTVLPHTRNLVICSQRDSSGPLLS